MQIFIYSLKRPGWDVTEPTLTASVRHSFCPKDSQSVHNANVTSVQVTDFIMIGVELQITFSLEQNVEKTEYFEHGYLGLQTRYCHADSTGRLANGS